MYRRYTAAFTILAGLAIAAGASGATQFFGQGPQSIPLAGSLDASLKGIWKLSRINCVSAQHDTAAISATLTRKIGKMVDLELKVDDLNGVATTTIHVTGPDSQTSCAVSVMGTYSSTADALAFQPSGQPSLDGPGDCDPVLHQVYQVGNFLAPTASGAAPIFKRENGTLTISIGRLQDPHGQEICTDAIYVLTKKSDLLHLAER